jgi:hypothetical protein
MCLKCISLVLEPARSQTVTCVLKKHINPVTKHTFLLILTGKHIAVFVSVCTVKYPSMSAGTSSVGIICMWHKLTVFSVQHCFSVEWDAMWYGRKAPLLLRNLLHLHSCTLTMVTAGFSAALVTFCQTVWHHIQEHFHIYCNNLKSHTEYLLIKCKCWNKTYCITLKLTHHTINLCAV